MVPKAKIERLLLYVHAFRLPILAISFLLGCVILSLAILIASGNITKGFLILENNMVIAGDKWIGTVLECDLNAIR